MLYCLWYCKENLKFLFNISQNVCFEYLSFKKWYMWFSIDYKVIRFYAFFKTYIIFMYKSLTNNIFFSDFLKIWRLLMGYMLTKVILTSKGQLTLFIVQLQQFIVEEIPDKVLWLKIWKFIFLICFVCVCVWQNSANCWKNEKQFEHAFTRNIRI